MLCLAQKASKSIADKHQLSVFLEGLQAGRLRIVLRYYTSRNLVLTTNKAFKRWLSIFNGDSTITADVLDRLLHHAHTVVIEGTSYRMKDRLET